MGAIRVTLGEHLADRGSRALNAELKLNNIIEFCCSTIRNT